MPLLYACLTAYRALLFILWGREGAFTGTGARYPAYNKQVEALKHSPSPRPICAKVWLAVDWVCIVCNPELHYFRPSENMRDLLCLYA